MCGADFNQMTDNEWDVGSPPRVRSRPTRICYLVDAPGITSACAEQTAPPITATHDGTDHLRVCGADRSDWYHRVTMDGSPPRVRSRLYAVRGKLGGHGITSACAEQTQSDVRWSGRCRDHLRVCGADGAAQYALEHHGGSPPRVRSRHGVLLRSVVGLGITSACAEQTRWRKQLPVGRWDHLRVCGADYTSDCS